MDFSTSKGMAVSRQGSQQFATGIAVGNQKSLVFNKYAADVMRKMAVDLFEEQAKTASFGLEQRSGELMRHLRSAPYSVIESNGGVFLQLKYILKVRFLDLKKTRRGNTKPNYTPIYNRLVWGFVFGDLYPQLRYGFTEQVRHKYVGTLKEIFKDPV